MTETLNKKEMVVNRKRLKLKLQYVFLAGIVLLLYSPTFVSLARSYIGENSYYNHWFLVPLVSGFFVWIKRRQLASASISVSKVGLAIVILSLCMHIVGVLFRIDFISPFCFVITVWGIVLYVFGKQVFKAIFFPLFFLLFMVPLPGVVVSPLAFYMKILAAKAGAALTNLLGLPAVLVGSRILFQESDPLLIGNVCSGLRSLISLVTFGAAYAYLFNSSRIKRLTLFLSSIPLALLSNAIRITGLCFAAHFYGIGTKQYETFHTFSSPLVFIVVLLGLVLVKKLLSLGSKETESKSAAGASSIKRDNISPHYFAGLRRRLAILTAIFVLAAIPIITFPRSWATTRQVSNLKKLQLPEVLGDWHQAEEDIALSKVVYDVLQTKSILASYYENRNGIRLLLLAVLSESNRQAFHPPKICMIGSGEDVLEKWSEPISINSKNAKGLYLNAFIFGEHGRPQNLVLYWFTAGGKSFGSRSSQQLSIFLNGIKRVPTIGGMFRITVPLDETTKEEALVAAKSFIKTLIPILPKQIEETRTSRR